MVDLLWEIKLDVLAHSEATVKEQSVCVCMFVCEGMGRDERQ